MGFAWRSVGNDTRVPVNLPVDVCGNTMDVVAAANPAVSSKCGSDDADATNCCSNDPAEAGHCRNSEDADGAEPLRPIGSGPGNGSPAALSTEADSGAGQGSRTSPAGPLKGRGQGRELGVSPRSGSSIPAPRVHSLGAPAATGAAGDSIGLAAAGGGLPADGAMLDRRGGAMARY
ncbi:chaplin [Streptomyces sp. NPDC002896]|uniref:chaplin n=1 Tax=Streptomyces sp. NPDC002896 TaxID=3154438 RepID=UPI003319829D